MAKDLRMDITGLRAIAVLSVTIYHLVHVLTPEFTYFRGGFLGVDIFFVISGYLMTMIIMKGLSHDNFSLYDFYKRRAQRICPALMVTIAVFMILGYLLIGVSDLKRMCYEAFTALFFVSNMYFAQKTDYFANSALDQAFLHTWSLSVEWQFYMFYPLLLILLRKFMSTKSIARTVLVLTIFFLIFACYLTNNFPRYSYYILPSRAFELMFGALAYYYPLSFFRVVAKGHLLPETLRARILAITPLRAEAAGLIIIFISLAVIDDAHGWPTLWAVVPLFGTYLCIAADNKKSLLRNIVFQKLGLWSYAIYLAHWPLIVFITKLGFNVWCLELLIPIFILGVLLHYLVERRRNFGYVFLGSYFVVALCAWYISINGAKFRLDHEVTRYAQYGGHSVPFEGTINAIGNLERKPDFILIGDSFARHYALDLIDRGLHVITVFRDGCYSWLNYVNRRSEGHIDEKCAMRYSEAKKAVDKYPDLPIVVAQDWPRYQGSLVRRSNDFQVPEHLFEKAVKRDIQSMAARFKNRKLYIIGTPRQTVFDVGSTCMYLHALQNPLSRFIRAHFTCTKSKELNAIPMNDFLQRSVLELPQNQHLTDKDRPVKYIDPNEAICVDSNCEILVGKYIPVYQDGLHYSWAGSVKIVSYILSQIGVKQGKVRTNFEDEVVGQTPEGESVDKDEGYADGPLLNSSQAPATAPAPAPAAQAAGTAAGTEADPAAAAADATATTTPEAAPKAVSEAATKVAPKDAPQPTATEAPNLVKKESQSNHKAPLSEATNTQDNQENLTSVPNALPYEVEPDHNAIKSDTHIAATAAITAPAAFPQTQTQTQTLDPAPAFVDLELQNELAKELNQDLDSELALLSATTTATTKNQSSVFYPNEEYNKEHLNFSSEQSVFVVQHKNSNISNPRLHLKHMYNAKKYQELRPQLECLQFVHEHKQEDIDNVIMAHHIGEQISYLYSQISSDHDRPQLADPREEYKYFEEVKSTKCKLKDKQHYLTPEEIQHLEDLGLLGDYS